MSMSTHAVGFRQADDRWKHMKAIWDACNQANIDPPKEVAKFFDGRYPGDAPGMEIDLGKALKSWGRDGAEGFEVVIDKLPEGVKVIRFYNSW